MRAIHLSKHLEERYRRLRAWKENLSLAGIIAFTLGLVAIAGQVSLLSEVRYHLPWVLFLVCFLGCVVAISTLLTDLARLKTGIMGEVRLQAHLQRFLPDDEYTCYFNVPTLCGDIDCVIVGPTGVYVIEAKNQRGVVTYADGRWENIKVSGQGNPYRGQVFDPSRQVMTGVMTLKAYLADHGISVWVRPVVVFTNPAVRLFTRKDNGIEVLHVSEMDTLFASCRRLDPSLVGSITVVLDLLGGQLTPFSPNISTPSR